MPSQRKRIGFLPSEEVHEIIDKLCKANEFSQSKVTGLLVEEALRSRGVLNEDIQDQIHDLLENLQRIEKLKNKDIRILLDKVVRKYGGKVVNK